MDFLAAAGGRIFFPFSVGGPKPKSPLKYAPPSDQYLYFTGILICESTLTTGLPEAPKAPKGPKGPKVKPS